MKRIVIPTDDAEGTVLAAHFGRAPYFVVVEIDESGKALGREIHQNTGSHAGGQGFTHDNILGLKPDAVVVGGMGPRGLVLFQSQAVSVFRANSGSVERIVAAYSAGQLDKLTEGCHDAHHTA